ncbi:TVP38/TMEM64 family protein [Cohnella endophytica]|uniref:TVP38/TMEM64 family membrane protein n=1 Tax=Cohnella endophytica TaxID=2419778 RepID=A0A494XVX2_9BACL|nr:TVP38/TMEM64 family protein [Cohnella endophytica]RKP53106.1 TVP38/TMEM64 family protein [Cohnella endophytica]
MRRATLLKISAAAAIVALLLWIDFTYIKANPESIRQWVLSFGWMAPSLYIGIYIVRPFVLFPASVLSMAGGLAFGTWFGMAYTLVGAVTGAVLSFLFARKIGAGFFRGKEDPRLGKIERAMQRRGFIMVLMLRIAPFVPFDLVSYAAGVARVRLKAFLPATIIGTLPGTFAYNFLGSSLSEGSWQDIAIAGCVFAVALAIPFLFRRKVEQEVEENGGDLEGDGDRAS